MIAGTPPRPRAGLCALAGLALLIAAPAGSAARTEAGLAAGMDRSIAPGDDFFGFANGAWIAEAQIPPGASSVGAGAILVALTEKRTDGLIRDLAAHPQPAGSEARKIADYYESLMDVKGVEAKGVSPLKPELARIAAIANRKDLAKVLGASLRADVDVLNNTNLHTDRLFGLWVAKDLDDPKHYSPFLLQGGLGMPDRAYYLDPSPPVAALRDAYRDHIARVLQLAGVGDAEPKAQRIYDLEAAIAAVHASQAESVQARAGDNHWARSDFAKQAPGLDWDAYFTAAGLNGEPRFVVWQPAAVKGIAALTAGQPVETWKDYLTFHAIDRASPVLSRAFVEERFAFYGKTLAGQPVLGERVVALINGALGDAVGKVYVRRYFAPEAKAKIQAMAQNLLTAFHRRIAALEWMSPGAKAKALAKLAVLHVGVGYPDHWRDYSGLEVVRGDAYGNWARASLYDYHQSLAKLGKPVDADEWVIAPQTVNAVSLPAANALNFPAAILQPPFFDPNRAAAMNYGAIGATIGHEISHFFDDQGAMFDASGRLHTWWTKEDFAHFEAASAPLAHQYDSYRPFPNLTVRGKQVLRENVADLAGLAAAYDAYRLSLAGTPAPRVDGFGGDQQFYLAFAQGWRSKILDAAQRQQVMADDQAPAPYRADTVRNIDAWYSAFAPKSGQALYLAPSERVKIW